MSEPGDPVVAPEEADKVAVVLAAELAPGPAANIAACLAAGLAAPARAHGCTLSLFPAYAQAMHDGDAYGERHAASVHTEEVMLGIGLHGPKRSVNRLTGSLPLWR